VPTLSVAGGGITALSALLVVGFVVVTCMVFIRVELNAVIVSWRISRHSAKPFPEFRSEPGEPTVLLRDDDARSEAGKRAKRNVKGAGSGWFFIAISEGRHICKPVAKGILEG